MFDLLKLPQEVRDNLHKQALVRESITITQTTASKAAKNQPRLRSTFTTRGCPRDFQISYQFRANTRDPPSLNLFLVNRQVYAETFPIFYKYNVFAFIAPPITTVMINTCLAFLYDRPHPALRCIRDIRLHIGSEPTWPIHSLSESTTWHSLCDELSRHLSLRTLELRIRGHFIGWQVAEPMDDNLNGRWAEELQKITGLRNLGFRLYNQRTLQENAAFVRGLGVAMLKNGHLLIDESDVVGLLEMKGGPGGLFLEAFLSTS